MSRDKTKGPPNVAGVYVRMRPGPQHYSASKQRDIIRKYAKRRGVKIVEYTDDGKSGHDTPTA